MSFLSERTKIGLSQATVADELGVSAASVSLWETGKTHPRAELLPRIAQLYQCTIDELFSNQDDTQADR